MNVIFISPNYPSEHWRYVLALREAGNNILCIGDAGDETFPWELRGAMTAYRRVSDLHEYDEVYRCAAGYVSQYGRIERVETLNPYWRDMAEALRQEFCRLPLSPSEFFYPEYKLFKDEVKQNSVLSGGRVVTGSRQAASFARKSGYPFIASPVKDKRLPREAIYDDKQRKKFFKQYPDESFYLTTLPAGQRVVVTGFALPGESRDYKSHDCRSVAFCAHLFFEDGMSALPVTVPDKIVEPAARYPGFFSIEAVKLTETIAGIGRKGSIIPISVTDTPPAAPLVDCLCAEYNVDFRRAWAESAGGMDPPERVCMTAIACRCFETSYKTLHERILGKLGAKLIRHGHMEQNHGFGDYMYLFSGESLAEMKRGVKLISEN